MNMGFLAALAGMVTIARMTSAQPTYGQNYEMDAIGSCFILGGASAYGRRATGTVPGVIVGAVLMGVINLGMSLMGVDQNMQKVVKGLVLLAAVIFDVVSKRGWKINCQKLISAYTNQRGPGAYALYGPFLGMKAVPILPAYLQEEVIVKKREKRKRK